MSHHETWARQEETVIVTGRVLTDGSAIPLTTAANVRGKGAVVTRTGVGQYLITITSDGTRKYPQILSAKVDLAIATDDVKAKLIAVSETNGTVSFETITATAAADIANVELHYTVVCKNTGVA
jgi:hypothetical protein